jgi:hypothetical protein
MVAGVKFGCLIFGVGTDRRGEGTFISRMLNLKKADSDHLYGGRS